MRSVLEKLPLAEFLLGKQGVSEAKFYRMASFCVLDGGILFNNLTKELVELDETERELFKCDKISASDISRPLIEGYFLVPLDNDDKKLCDGLCAFSNAAAQKKGYTSFTVFTTTECNARCFYCYEHSAKRASMTLETAKQTADFIIKSSNGAPVCITWYGGEPLVNKEAIDTVSKALFESGIQYTSTIATNASLFDSELIKKAAELWHTDKVQVTLDGTKEIYDRIKNYTDRESGFDDVIKNIGLLLLYGIKVNIRLNVDSHNIGNMRALCAFLAEKFSGKRGINVYCDMLFDNCEWAKRPSANVDRLAIAKEIIEIEDIAAKRGILQPRRLHRAVSGFFCKADAPDAIVITPEGKLVKCDFFTDSHFVGDVFLRIDGAKLQMESEIFGKKLDCGACTAYPICMRLANCPTGGCDEARKYLAQQRLLRSIRYLYDAQREKK